MRVSIPPAMIKRGEKLGVLRPDIDPEVGIALLLGPMITGTSSFSGWAIAPPKIWRCKWQTPSFAPSKTALTRYQNIV